MKKQNTNSKDNYNDDFKYNPIDDEQQRLDDFLQECMETYWQQYDDTSIPWPYDDNMEIKLPE